MVNSIFTSRGSEEMAPTRTIPRLPSLERFRLSVFMKISGGM